MSYSRQMRRAAERKARKQERQAARLPEATTNHEITEIPAAETALIEEVVTAASERELTRSVGPRTAAGKAVSCLNNLQHGLTGAFRVLASESQEAFDAAHHALLDEHQPTTPTESELIRRMAEHVWLSRRAQLLQDAALTEDDLKKFTLFLRYQTTNDRGFRACLDELIRLRREQRRAAKEFESQKQAAEWNAARVRLANARAAQSEVETEAQSLMQTPIPGYSSVPVEQVKDLFRSAMSSLNGRQLAQAAA